uniref:Putative splicing factor, arginine/serine-rich 4 n=1 Tax=Anthurium amnicola TaxID=1678845 RepID=A0A1D1ZJN0_9ARAE
MAASSPWCLVSPTPPPPLLRRRPSPAAAAGTLSSSKPLPRVLHVAARPERGREPFLGSSRRRGGCACAGSSTTGGAPNPCPRNRIFIKGDDLSLLSPVFGQTTRTSSRIRSHSSNLRWHATFLGLPSSTSEGTLGKTFSQFGHVTRVKIITSKISEQSLGLAYVWFASEEDAQFAAKEMDGKFVDGRFVYVTIARPESPTKLVRATPYRF